MNALQVGLGAGQGCHAGTGTEHWQSLGGCSTVTRSATIGSSNLIFPICGRHVEPPAPCKLPNPRVGQALWLRVFRVPFSQLEGAFSPWWTQCLGRRGCSRQQQDKQRCSPHRGIPVAVKCARRRTGHVNRIKDTVAGSQASASTMPAARCAMCASERWSQGVL